MLLKICFFFLVLQCLIMTASSDRNGKFISRLLSQQSNRCTNQVDSYQVIGYYNETVLDINPFDIPIQDNITIWCSYNQSCVVDQVFQILEGNFSQSFEFTAEGLPQAWMCLGTIKALLLDKVDLLAEAFTDLVENVDEMYDQILSFRAEFVSEINDFLISFNNSASGLNEQVVQEIIVTLNNTNSDLALQFEQILVQAFNILSGRLLQQVSSDYLAFNNKLQNILQVIQNEILSKKGALSTANSTLILENIDLIAQNFSNLTQEYATQFAKYQEIQDNYSSIVDDLLRTQIIDKFNFSDANVTTAVKKFLLNIIQVKRNLVNETRSLFEAQLQEYQGDLNTTINDTLSQLNDSLTSLKEFLVANSTNQSNEVNSFFTNSSKIEALLFFNITIDPLGALNQIASKAFADAFDQFQSDFMQFVSNIEEIFTEINDTFTGNYTALNQTVDEYLVNVTYFVGNKMEQLWIDIATIENILKKIIVNILDSNYEFSYSEERSLKKYNMFEGIGVVEVFKNVMALKTLIQESVQNLTQRIEESNNLNISLENLNLTVITDSMIENLTILINQTMVEAIVGTLNVEQNFYEMETLLGIQKENMVNVSVTQFLQDIAEVFNNTAEQCNEILKAIVQNNFTNITSLNQTEIAAIKSRLSSCSMGNESQDINFTGLPANYSFDKVFTLVNLSYQGIENFMSLEFSMNLTMNGSYGTLRNDTAAMIYFQLQPEIAFSMKIMEQLKMLSFLNYSAGSNASGSGNISNNLMMGLLMTTSEFDFMEANLIDVYISEITMNVTTSQQFINVTTVESCDNETTTCVNVTSYGWEDPVVMEKNATIPKEHQSIRNERMINFYNLTS